MIRDPDALFEFVSRRVADGEAIDWNALAVDTQTRAVVEELKVLAEVARLHRDTLPDPAGPAALPPPPVHPGDPWGHLTIRSEIGRGARGYVFRAWDPQLDREVALKLTVDRGDERAAKDVIGEARLLARVRHPHVATIYGAERRDGLVGLWMELIEGETLEAMLSRVGRFNPREVALIGLDVCSALSAVHAAGLLHRDVKAQNVMRDRNGRLVLMDFGTSRDLAADEGAFVHDEVGTPMYMAPELFEGGKASIQSDIYSVGVLLYRLVTGSVPVEAHSPTALREAHQTRARIPLADVRSDLPVAFIRVVERALSTDAAERYPSAGALEMALSSLLVPMEPQAAPRHGGRLLAVGAAIGALVAGLATGAWWWASRPPAPQEVRFAVVPASPREDVQHLALSPDGLRLVYTSAGRLHLRRMNDVGALELEQTQGARDPFWSPDGQWIGFFRGVSVWKMRASGGEPQLVAPARRPSSGSWSTDGTLLYSVDHGTSLMVVSATGGPPRVVRLQRPGLRTAMAWPSWLPDGKHFVYSAVSARSGRRTIYLARSADGPDAEDRALLEAPSNPLVVGTRLFVVMQGQVRAQHLDVGAGRLVGEPVPVVDGVAVDPYGPGDADFSVALTTDGRFGSAASARAVVAFVGSAQGTRSMRVVDPTGTPIETLGSAEIRDLRLSPDGRLLAYEEIDAESGTREIWVHDFERRSRIRLTQHAAEDISPMWSPDSRTVYFISYRDARVALYGTSAHGGQREQPLLEFDRQVVAYDITPDGRSLIFQRLDQQGGWDIWERSLAGGPPVPLVQSTSNDQHPAISPDGRLLAYSTPESGGQQVWVMPRPADGRRWRVSSDYGREPAWSADGRTLYYHGLNRTLIRVAVDGDGATPTFGPPSALFTIPFRGYDVRHHVAVLPGGARFLVNAPPESLPPASATVVLNARVP
jgi:Tol biopolymer transport system component